MYQDLILNYFKVLADFWKDLINISVEDSLTSNIRETNKIKNEIRQAVTEGISLAIEDLKDQLHEESLNNYNYNLYKNIAFVTGITF